MGSTIVTMDGKGVLHVPFNVVGAEVPDLVGLVKVMNQAHSRVLPKHLTGDARPVWLAVK